jgi:hypothetical protein
MAARYRVTADWDAEAGVWVSTSDVPGLVIETATLAEFEAVMRDLVPELLAENGGVEGPVSIEWTSHGAFELAAA